MSFLPSVWLTAEAPRAQRCMISKILRELCTAILESFLSLRKFSDCYSSCMQHMTNDILTTKITKATKGSDIFAYKLRALRVLRVKSVFSFLVAAPAGMTTLE